jgi:hypothetical protein
MEAVPAGLNNNWTDPMPDSMYTVWMFEFFF